MRHRMSRSALQPDASPSQGDVRQPGQALVKHEQIMTTLPKAKDLRPVVEKLITLGKRGDLHARRLLIARTRNEATAAKLIDVLGPRYERACRRLCPDPQGRLPLRRQRADGGDRVRRPRRRRQGQGLRSGPGARDDDEARRRRPDRRSHRLAGVRIGDHIEKGTRERPCPSSLRSWPGSMPSRFVAVAVGGPPRWLAPAAAQERRRLRPRARRSQLSFAPVVRAGGAGGGQHHSRRAVTRSARPVPRRSVLPVLLRAARRRMPRRSARYRTRSAPA